MNGIGIATTVALGIAVGFAAGAPADFPRAEMAITIGFWSMLSGVLFEAFRMALAAQPPFKR